MLSEIFPCIHYVIHPWKQVWIEIHQNYWSMICGDLNMYSVRWEIPKFCSWFQLRKSKILGATRVDLRCDRQLPPTHHQATECRIGPRRMSVRVPTWSGKPNCASDIHTRKDNLQTDVTTYERNVNYSQSRKEKSNVSRKTRNHIST